MRLRSGRHCRRFCQQRTTHDFLSSCFWIPGSWPIFSLTIELLQHDIRDFFCMAPPASTWYRLRNPTSPNQPPLCSRAYPPGVPSADEKTGEQRARGDGLVMCGPQHCLHGRSWGPPYHWSSFHLVSTRIPAVGRRQRRASFSRLSLPYFGRRPQTPDISSLDRPKIRGRIFSKVGRI